MATFNYQEWLDSYCKSSGLSPASVNYYCRMMNRDLAGKDTVPSSLSSYLSSKGVTYKPNRPEFAAAEFLWYTLTTEPAPEPEVTLEEKEPEVTLDEPAPEPEPETFEPIVKKKVYKKKARK